MSNQIITTRCAPRRNLAREELSSPNCVRVYQNSPEDGILQLRLRKEYVSITLYPAELREIAALLLAVATEIDGAAA